MKTNIILHPLHAPLNMVLEFIVIMFLYNAVLHYT